MMMRGVALATLGLALRRRARSGETTDSWSACSVLHELARGARRLLRLGGVASSTDIDRDRATDVIISEPCTPDGGRTWVYSGPHRAS